MNGKKSITIEFFFIKYILSEYEGHVSLGGIEALYFEGPFVNSQKFRPACQKIRETYLKRQNIGG